MSGTRASPLLVAALCGGYFLVLLDVTVVNVALPSIAAALPGAGAGLAWVVDGYAVPLAALLLAAGAVGDRIGHRTVVLAGYAGFGLASLGCAVAPGIGVLVGARAVQGAAAALVLPGTLALLSDLADDERRRARLVGVWASVGGAALPAGPLLGGVLVQVAGWRAVFWLGIPVVVAAVVPIARLPHERPATGTRDVDLAGAALAVLLLGAAVTGIIQSRDGPVLASSMGVVALLAAIAMVLVERRADRPLLSVPRPARGPLLAACAVAGLMNLCVLGTLFLLTQVLQGDRGLGPLRAGLVLLPAMLPLPLLGGPAGRLTGRHGPWAVSAAGLATAAVGFGAVAWCAASAPIAGLLVALVVWGCGVGLLTPAVVTAAMGALPGAPGVASGASNTARQAGGAVGVAVFGAMAGSIATPGFTHRAELLITTAAVAFALASGWCALGSRTGCRRTGPA